MKRRASHRAAARYAASRQSEVVDARERAAKVAIELANDVVVEWQRFRATP